MTTFDMPHLGWHTQNWGRMRSWLAHQREHRTGDFNDDHYWSHRAELEGEDAERPALEPVMPAPEPARRLVRAGRSAALWAAGLLAVLVLADPAASKRVALALLPWLLAVAIAAAGVLLAWRQRKHASSLANAISRKQAHKTARARRAARQRQNREAHAQALAERDEKRRRDREARRQENRDAHRRLSDDF